MAAAGVMRKASLLAALAAIALILSSAAEASTLTVFTGPGCSGHTKDVNYVCGCYDISGYRGGYHFVFTEHQSAYLHRSYHCRDRHPFLLASENRYCYSTGFKSVYMAC